MPRGKRLSKKIYDKKKSNPKRNIRKSKKGGILTKKTSLEQLVSIPNSIQIELTQIENNDNKCFSQALITNIENVVGGFISGARRGVVECSSIKDMKQYGECENKKIDAYTKIRDLCKEGSVAVTNCSNKYFGYSYKTVFDKLSKNAEKLRKIHQDKLDNNQDYQEYIKNQQQQAEQQAQQQAQAKFNTEEEKYEKIIGNKLWPIRERYKRAKVVFFYKKNNEMVKLGTIKSTSENTHSGSGGFSADNYYVKFSKEINSGTKDTEIRIAGTPSEDGPAPEIPLYYEKDKYNDALQEAAELIEKEEKKKQELEKEERQMQEEERRKQEEKEYNNADTVDDKIAIRLKYNKTYQYYVSRLDRLSTYNPWIPEIKNKMEEIREKITKQEKEKEEDKKFQEYLYRQNNADIDQYISNAYNERQKLENEEVTAAHVDNTTETNQPGGKRRSRKKRNMKKSKKGKSKNRR